MLFRVTGDQPVPNREGSFRSCESFRSLFGLGSFRSQVFLVPGHFGPGLFRVIQPWFISFRSLVISVPDHFEPGHFDPESFRYISVPGVFGPRSFRLRVISVLGCFGLGVIQPRFISEQVVLTPGHFGPGSFWSQSFRSRVIPIPHCFGPGSFSPGSFRTGSFRSRIMAVYMCYLPTYRDLTRILKTGVRDSSKRKSRSPRQNLGVPLYTGTNNTSQTTWPIKYR